MGNSLCSGDFPWLLVADCWLFLQDEGPPEPEEEARTVGKVAWRVYADYLRHGGAVLVLVAVLVLMLGSQVSNNISSRHSSTGVRLLCYVKPYIIIDLYEGRTNT